MFPISFSGCIDIGDTSQERVSEVTARLVSALDRMSASNVVCDVNTLTFRAGGLGPAGGGWNVLSRVDRGTITVLSGSPGSVRYDLSCVKMLRTVTLMVMLMGVVTGVLPGSGIPFWVFVVMWLWLFGGNYLIGSFRLRAFIHEAVEADAAKLPPESPVGHLPQSIEPSAPPYRVEVTADGVCVLIPARRNWVIALLLVISIVLLPVAWWFGIGPFGGIDDWRQLPRFNDKASTAFVALCILSWAAYAVTAAGGLIWQLAGQEILTLDPLTVSHRIEALGVGRTRTFQASEIRRFRVNQWSSNPFSNQSAWYPPITGEGRGPLTFDYGARAFRFGSALDQAEAAMLLRELKAHLPRSA
jgi:hypothetical protein